MPFSTTLYGWNTDALNPFELFSVSGYSSQRMPFLTNGPSLEYIAISNGQDNEHEKDELALAASRINRQAISFTVRQLVALIAAWVLLTGVLLTFVVTYIQPSSRPQDVGLRKGEFAPAGKVIVSEQVLFTASTTFNKSRDPPRQFRQNGPLYVGNPTQDIDNAWAELLDDQYFYITADQAQAAWGDGYQKYWRDESYGGYRAGLSVFHTLHCLNLLRKTIYKEYYWKHSFKGLNAELQMYHIDHCVDIIRQSIQCSADLTPIPVTWYDAESGRSTIDSERVHTCRSIDELRRWTTQEAAMSRTTARRRTG
ncbi:hypothetical protein DOTSEDRAFT_53464 [Dothistroma septosporum NZE10]|uniref:Uncharacterized protein n=1 Tax=Dothistroma septosporum (strain NZE10 / CBS 128990) TaxID=675120 RepID=N1PPM1_DOTSN|nr:hypothetical protein DOTSEDRAFT_53464 [Dothistroma septosporum NZE10]